MSTAFQLKTFPEIMARMFATAQTQLGDDIDLNVGSMIRTFYESAGLQDAELYVQLARLLDLFSIDDCLGDDLDERAWDYGAEVFEDLRRQGARTSITKITVGDGTLAVFSKLIADYPAGVVVFEVTAGEGANFDDAGSIILERGTSREEEVIFTRSGDIFSVVSPPAGTVHTHTANGKVEALAIKSIITAKIVVGASACDLESGTEGAWPSSGTIIFERDTVRRESFTFTRAGTTITLTSGVTVFDHEAGTDVILSTHGSDRAVALGSECYVPETAAASRILYRTTTAGTLYDGDYTTSLIDVESNTAGGDTLAGANTLTKWSLAPFSAATVTNPFAATRGRNRETDDVYRNRIRDFVQSLSRATPLAIETLVAGQVDPYSDKTVAFAQVVEAVGIGEAIMYISDGSTTFAIDYQIFSGRDVLISTADAGDLRTRLNEYAPFQEVSTPVASRTPRIFKSVERGTATSVGVNYLEDTGLAMTPNEHIGHWLKTDDDVFYKIESNTAIRFNVEAGGATPSLGDYSVHHFGQSVEVLTLTGQPLDTETVTIDTKVYTFQTVLTDVDGNVLIGATASDSLDNLIAAITLGDGAGTVYAVSTTPHTTATAEAGVADSMRALALLSGTAGDSIATTETLTNGSWGAATMSGGSDPLEPGVDYTFNKANGDLELAVTLAAADSLVAASDGALASVGGYTYSRGLAAFTQRLVNGDRTAVQNYPGIKAAGAIIRVVAPTIIAPSLVIQIITETGITDADLEDTVKAVVQAIVNSLGIAGNIILSEIVRLVKGLAGIEDVRVISPTNNVPVADGQLARISDTDVVVV